MSLHRDRMLVGSLLERLPDCGLCGPFVPVASCVDPVCVREEEAKAEYRRCGRFRLDCRHHQLCGQV